MSETSTDVIETLRLDVIKGSLWAVQKVLQDGPMTGVLSDSLGKAAELLEIAAVHQGARLFPKEYQEAWAALAKAVKDTQMGARGDAGALAAARAVLVWRPEGVR